MKLRALIVLPIVAVTLAACGSSSSSSSSSTTSSSPATSSSTSAAAPASGGGGSGGGVQVTMKGLAFHPDAVHAKVGQTVKWTNDDTPPHNVTYVSGPKFTSSSTMNPGATFSIKLTKAGTIHYYCTIHPFMKATIVVTQ